MWINIEMESLRLGNINPEELNFDINMKMKSLLIRILIVGLI